MNNDPGLMLAALSNKRNGFFLIETEGYDARADLVQKLKLGLGKMVSEIERVDFSKNKKKLDFFEFLLQSIHNREIPPEIILLENIEEDPGFQDDPDNYLFRINLFREPLEQLGANIVFVTSPKFADQLLRRARDLTDWITQRFTFESEKRINPGLFMKSLSYCYPELGMDKRDKEYDKKMLELLLSQEKDAVKTGKDEGYIARVILPDIAEYFFYTKDYENSLKTAERALSGIDSNLQTDIYTEVNKTIGRVYLLKASEIRGDANPEKSQLLEKALSALNLALEKNPNNPEIPFYLGITYNNIGNNDKAIEYYQKSILINPNSPTTLNRIGITYAEAKEYNKALEYFEKALLLKPNNPETFSMIGVTHAKLKNYHKAIEYFQKSLLIRPDNPNILNNMGAAYADLKNYHKAIEFYEKSLLIKPDNAYALGNMGVAYANIEDYNKAIECFQKALLIKLDDSNILTFMGAAYADLENYIKAIEFYEKALLIEPENADALSNMGVAYAKLEDYHKAIEFFDKSLLIKPENVYALGNMGVAYAKLKDYDKAIKCYKKVLQINPQDNIAFYNLARTASLTGNKQESLEWLQKAVDANNDFRELAKTDSDFDSLRDDPEFRRIVYSE